VSLQHPFGGEVHRSVESRLPAEGGENGIGLLARDDAFNEVRGDGLDVGRVGELRIGHDRCRVRVDEDDAVALLAQDLARLHARVIELAGLADDYRTRTEDEDAVDVPTGGH
jgi:hypothetical protein